MIYKLTETFTGEKVNDGILIEMKRAGYNLK